MKRIISLLIIASFLVGGANALAQTEENIKVGIEPDSVFYFLENWKEQIQLFFTFNLEKKAEQYLKLSEERLAEYQRMLEKGKDEIAAKVLSKYENQLGHALEIAKKFQEKKGDSAKNKIIEVSGNISKHVELLQGNLLKVKESVKKGIENAIESAQKVMERFNNPDEQENIQGGNGQVIGGDKDINGCLGTAGYSWCESKGKCLRVFEEWCSDRAKELVDNIQGISGEKFQYKGEISLLRKIFKDSQIKSVVVDASMYEAIKDVSIENYKKIQKYFNENLQLDEYNTQKDSLYNRSYLGGYMTCDLSYSPGYSDNWNTWFQSSTLIKCGFFNNNLSE